MFRASKLPILFKDGVLSEVRTILAMRAFFSNDGSPATHQWNVLLESTLPWLPITQNLETISQVFFDSMLITVPIFAFQRKTQRSIFETFCARSAKRKFIFLASKYLRKTCFRQSRFPLVPDLLMSFEANEPRIRVPHVSKPPGNPRGKKRTPDPSRS